MRNWVPLLLTAAGLVHGASPRVIVLVIDGLRPDAIRPDIMPNLARLKQEGTWCANAHSVFPTVTRVNSASISTGTLPAIHGIVSNTMWVEAVSARPFDTSNYQNLVKLAAVSGGRALAAPTLAETLEEAGVRFVALTSGSTGSGFLLNPEAISGNGVLISAGLEEGKRAAYPDRVNQEIQRRFGIGKADEGIPSLLWTEKVLRGYVIPEMKPAVVIDWMTEPDGAQHRFGVGSPEAMEALKVTDEQIGLLLDQVRKSAPETNLIVTADHGFGAEPDPVDLEGALKGAGVAGDVVTASNGASVLIYAKNHDSGVIQKTVERLQQTDGVDVIFTAAAKPDSGIVHCADGRREQGWVKGTFSLERAGECNASRGADIIATFQWSSEKNAFGFAGAQKIASNDKRSGVAGRSGHGGLNPWMLHTPLLLWGPDFRKRTEIQAPVGNFDIAPTILSMEGIPAPPAMSGRAIAEGLAKSKTKEPARKVRTIRVKSGTYCAEIQISAAGSHEYLDSGQRGCGI